MTDDALTHMIERQLEFQRRLGYDFAAMSDRERVEYVRLTYVATVMELGEVLNEVSWKPWATGERFDVEGIIGEVTDVWHFLMNLLLVALPAATPAEVAVTLRSHYDAKQVVNRRRQDAGYDGVSGKCPHCHRSYDDAATKCQPAKLTECQGYLQAWCNDVGFLEHSGAKSS